MPALFAPPPGPPRRVTPLIPTDPCPYAVNFELLAERGWVTLDIQPSTDDPLYNAFSILFRSSAQFFGLPEEEKSKYAIKMLESSQDSEEGYCRLIGTTKSWITLRKVVNTPTEFELKERAAMAWRASGEVMRGVMKGIEASLGMQDGVLQLTMGPNVEELPGDGKQNVATRLRMFRYGRPVAASPSDPLPSPELVTHAHEDLSLLTLVVGHTPGLECWDPVANDWASCEEGNGGKISATILVGLTLAKFTNWRYLPGMHRVFVHPLQPPPSTDAGVAAGIDTASDPDSFLKDPAYRFSLVHVVPGHLPVRVSSADFTTPITGTCPPEMQFTDVAIDQISKIICGSQWNVNIDVAERRRQAGRLQEKAAEVSGSPVNGGGTKRSRSWKRPSIATFKELFKWGSRHTVDAS